MPEAKTSGSRVADSGDKPSPYAIPWDVAGRIIFLFVALCALKLAILVVFRKHLYEIQWRVNQGIYDWRNAAAFYLFAALVGMNLWQFARRCSAGGARTVRAANALVLAAGASFIFLTFQANGSNYLYPVIHGTLSWWDLRWYLSQVFFFQWPFLAAWIFIYAAIYYFLARTKREHLVLHLTAIFAAIYVATCLHDLEATKAALSADCLGIACLVAGTGVLRSANWLCAIQPWLWIAFIFLLFQSPAHRLVFNDPEVATLWGWSVVLFGGLSIFAWRRNFFGAWLWLLAFAFPSFLLLININYSDALNYRHLVFMGLTLPHYFLGAFFVTLPLLIAATVYRRWLPKASLLWLDVINLLLIIISLLDLRLAQIMGIRLDWEAIHFGADPKMVWRLAQPYLPGLTLTLIVLVGLYAVFIGLWRRETAFKSVRIGRGGRFVMVAFLLLGFVGDWFAKRDKAEGQSAVLLVASSPLFAKLDSPVMDEKTFLRTAGQLGESLMTRPPSPPSHAPRDLNVVIIFQESSYNKYLSLFNGTENTEPLLSQYTNRMELFPNFFCNFAGSVYARFASFAGLYPVKDYDAFTLHRVDVKSLFDILSQNGYENSMFDSSYLDYTGWRDFLAGRGFKVMYDADTMPGRKEGVSVSWGLPEEETLKAMQWQIQQYATNHQKFCLTYIPVAPHNPFDGIPTQFRKYPPQKPGDYTPAYLNNLLYMDWIITSILNQLKNSGLLDHTLVIITDDHGEMLGENGGPVGHGWAVTPALANVPLIIMDPDKPSYRVNDTVGSQVDLLPTILDLLGIPAPDDQLYQGASLYSDRAQADRTIYLNSFQQFGIIEGHHLICRARETENTEAEALKTYAIVNNGTRTLFPETNAVSSPVPSISDFDQFQENLLQNYSYYCQIKK